MSWQVIEGPKTVKVTKSLAKQFSEMPHIRGDRPLRIKRLAHHKKSIEEGKFRNPEWATAVCGEDGVEYRINGRHTSQAFLEVPQQQIQDMKVILTKYNCETLEDVAELWATFDSKDTVRSAREIYSTFAGTLDAFEGICPSDIGHIAAGFGLFELYKDPPVYTDSEEKGKLLLTQPDFVVWAAEMIRGEGKCLRRGSVIGAMLACWFKNQGEAKKFWHLVRTGEGASPSTPDRKIQRFLLQTSIALGRAANNARTASQKEVYSKCIHAWNAWRKNESTDLKFYADLKAPKAV